jgi:hypothetical protein
MPRRLRDICRSSTTLRTFDNRSSFDDCSSLDDDCSSLDYDCSSLDYDAADHYSSHYCATGSIPT